MGLRADATWKDQNKVEKWEQFIYSLVQTFRITQYVEFQEGFHHTTEEKKRCKNWSHILKTVFQLSLNIPKMLISNEIFFFKNNYIEVLSTGKEQ